MSKTTGYYGDVTVLVKMRLRVSAEFKKVNKNNVPSKSAMLKSLKNGDIHDITDEEHLKYIEVVKVGENCDGEYSDTDEEMTPEDDEEDFYDEEDDV